MWMVKKIIGKVKTKFYWLEMSGWCKKLNKGKQNQWYADKHFNAKLSADVNSFILIFFPFPILLLPFSGQDDVYKLSQTLYL
jgi:hypothetical protein